MRGSIVRFTEDSDMSLFPVGGHGWLLRKAIHEACQPRKTAMSSPAHAEKRASCAKVRQIVPIEIADGRLPRFPAAADPISDRALDPPRSVE